MVDFADLQLYRLSYNTPFQYFSVYIRSQCRWPNIFPLIFLNESAFVNILPNAPYMVVASVLLILLMGVALVAKRVMSM